MRRSKNPYIILSSSDAKWTSALGLALIGLKYQDKLLLYTSTNLNFVLGRTLFHFVVNYIASDIARALLESAREVLDKQTDKNTLLNCIEALVERWELALYSFQVPIAQSYLFYTIKNVLFSSAESYYLAAPSTFIGVLAILGVQFGVKMTQAFCEGDGKKINFTYISDISFRKALSSTAIRICSVTIENDQKHIISKIVVLPILYYFLEPLAKVAIGLTCGCLQPADNAPGAQLRIGI